MKKLLLAPLLLASLNATTLTQLFNAIKTAPQSKIDNLEYKAMQQNKKSVQYSLYPKISLIGSVEHFNRDMSLVPITPTESVEMMKTQEAIPFGQNIQRAGITLNMPLYVREIYKNKEKMSYLLKSVYYKSKINLLNREVLLITFINNYNYLFSLLNSLKIEKYSIFITREAIKIGVKNGAIPDFELLRLNDSLNQIKVNMIKIQTQMSKLKAQIYGLTNMVLDNPIFMNSTFYQRGDLLKLKPLKMAIKADQKNIEAQKSKYYPKLILKAKATKNWTKAYNTDTYTQEDEDSIGIYFEWSIFNKQNNSSLQKAKISLNKDIWKLQKTRQELVGELLNLTEDIDYLNQQIKDTKNSVKLRIKLLKSAKIAFENQSMKVDEYLRYENNLAQTRADLAKFIAQKNITLANIAFIYGNDITKIFKEKK